METSITIISRLCRSVKWYQRKASKVGFYIGHHGNLQSTRILCGQAPEHKSVLGPFRQTMH